MLLSELLSLLGELAETNGISTPYIVGGLPRDRMFGLSDAIKDIDITTGDSGSLALGLAAHHKWPEANFKVFNDNHSSLDFKNIKVDFSNNFILPGIEIELEKNGISSPSQLQKEMFSRDFTINTILQPMNLTEDPLDITGKAIHDIKNKILRTPVNPNLTIGYDVKRILRALRLAIKFDLTIEDNIKEAILKYRGGISELPINQIKKQVNQMLNMDSEKTISILTEFKLLPIIPLSKLMVLKSTQNHMVQNLLDNWEL